MYLTVGVNTHFVGFLSILIIPIRSILNESASCLNIMIYTLERLKNDGTQKRNKRKNKNLFFGAVKMSFSVFIIFI